MTRIAAGTGTPNQPSIDDPPTNAVKTAPPGGPPVVPAGTRSSGVAGDAGPDRPAPMQGAGGRAVAIDVGVFLKALKQWEGEHPFMYADTRGYVTTGIGHLLKTPEAALKLPWRHSETGHAATPAEVRSTFERVREAAVQYKQDHPNAKGIPSATCGKLSDLVLPEGLPARLASHRLKTEFLPDLRKLFPGFDRYPLPAQNAIVDMGYNLGVAKLKHEFPAFVSACRAGNFADAAKQSHRSSCREERNQATADLLEQAARLNASVHTVTREIRL
jgi:GH24 family phage-related lysozyme (muramidase)